MLNLTPKMFFQLQNSLSQKTMSLRFGFTALFQVEETLSYMKWDMINDYMFQLSVE